MSQLESYQLLSKSYAGSEGVDFQTRLLKLFALIGLIGGFNDFSVWTEDKAADKFDDVLFSYKIGNETHFILLQAKHKLDKQKIKLSTFFNDKDFDLYKYFIAFIIIVVNFQIDSKTNIIDNLILCTSNTLPKLNDDSKTYVLTDQTPHSALYFEKSETHAILTNEGKLFKFDKTKENENLNLLLHKFLAFELVQILSDSNFEPFFLKYLKDYLFDFDGNSIELKNEFWNQGSDKHLLVQEINRKSNLKTYQKQGSKRQKTDFWESFKIKYQTDSNFKNKINSFNSDVNFIHNKLKTFLDTILFATDVDDSALDRNISLNILQLINDFSQFDKAFNLFNEYLKNVWLNFNKPSHELKNLRKLNKNHNLWEKLSKSKLLEVFKTVLDENILTSEVYKFSGSQKLKDFFKSPVYRCLFYGVSKGETFWACSKIFSLNDSIIYLKSSDTKFGNTLDIFKHSSNDFTLVIECGDSKLDVENLKEFVGKFVTESKAKLIIVCTKEIASLLNEYKKWAWPEDGSLCGKLLEDDTLCGQLAENDFKILQNKIIDFQGFNVVLKELLEEDQLKKTDLRKIKDLTQIRPSLSEPVIYLPRTLLREDHLKQDILEKLKDKIVHNENDYEIRLKKNEDVLLIEKSNPNQSLTWKKSSKSLDEIRPFIDKNEKTETSDEKFIEIDSHINIIQDIPGMGKSVFLDHFSYKLKEKHPIHWVQKFELQTYIDELQTIENENVDGKNISEMLSLFIKEFLKLESDSVERIVFESLFNKGQVKLAFDGFDEISNSHKEVLLKMISALSLSNNQFYISTRPQWDNMLENRLNQLAFSFKPFTHSDQKKFLLQFWEKDESYDNKAERILGKLNDTITKREKTFTGIPLITRLVAEFFEEKIDDEQSFENSLATNLSLFELVNYFADKKIEIFLIEKKDIKKSSKFYGRDFQTLKNKLKKLAFSIIFPQSNEASEEENDEYINEEFIDCGLVQRVNGKLKFLHQVIAEFLAALHIRDNFGKPDILEFLLKVVLVENGFQMIRFFINVFIKDTVDDKSRDMLKELIKPSEMNFTAEEFLFVAARESNIQTFEVFFGVICEILDKWELCSLLEKVKNDERKFYWNGSTLLYLLYENNDIASTTVLDKIYDKIGPEKFMKILRIETGRYNLSILHGSAQQGKNYLLLTKWIIQKYSSQPDFIKEIILKKNVDNGKNILFYAAQNFDKKCLVDFLNELKVCEENHEISLLSELLLEADCGRTFIEVIVINSKDKNEIVYTVFELLDWIQQYNQKVLERFFQIKKAPFLAFVAQYFGDHIFKFLKYLSKFEKPTEVLQCKSYDGAPFFFYIFNIMKFEDSIKNFENAFEFIRDNFQDFDLKDFLNLKNEDGNNLLYHIFERNRMSSKDFSDLFDCLKKIYKDLIRDLLVNRNNEGQNIFHLICEYKYFSITDIPEFFGHLLQNLCSDLPELPTILKQKDNDGNNFLYYIFLHIEDGLDSAEIACKILDLVKKVDNSLIKDLILGGNCFGAIIYGVDWFQIPNAFKRMLTYLEQNSNYISVKNYLPEDYSYFLLGMISVRGELDSKAVCESLDWVKKYDIADICLFKSLIYRKKRKR